MLPEGALTLHASPIRICVLLHVAWANDSATIDHVIRYDTVYLMCSTKLTCSQLSPPHGTNRKIKEKNELKNKPRGMMSPVRSHDRESSPGVEVLR